MRWGLIFFHNVLTLFWSFFSWCLLPLLFDLRTNTKGWLLLCVVVRVCVCVWLVATSSQMTSPGAMAAVFVLWLVIKVLSAHWTHTCTHTGEQQGSLVAFTLPKIYCIHHPVCAHAETFCFLCVFEQFKVTSTGPPNDFTLTQNISDGSVTSGVCICLKTIWNTYSILLKMERQSIVLHTVCYLLVFVTQCVWSCCSCNFNITRGQKWAYIGWNHLDYSSRIKATELICVWCSQEDLVIHLFISVFFFHDSWKKVLISSWYLYMDVWRKLDKTKSFPTQCSCTSMPNVRRSRKDEKKY